MDNIIRAAYCILVAAAVAIPGIAHSAYTSNPRLPTTYWIGSDGQWKSSVTFEARKTAFPTKYGKLTVPVSAASLGKLAKGAVGGPVGAAMTAYMLLNGWKWNQTANNFETEATTTTYERPPSGWPSNMDYACGAPKHVGQWNGWYGYTKLFESASAPTACNGLPYATGLNTEFINNCVGSPYLSCGGYWPNKRFVRLTQVNPTSITEETSPAQPASETDLGNYLQGNPDLLKKTLDDAIDRGYWRNKWPELEQALNDLSDALQRLDDGQPNTGDVELEKDLKELPPETPPRSDPDLPPTAAAEWPVFCSWATIVCDFIDWVWTDTGAPANPELPTETAELQTWDSGLGAGSCPAPYTTSFQGQTISYEFTDACWAAANVIKPLLIALSLIAAGFIIAGARV